MIDVVARAPRPAGLGSLLLACLIERQEQIRPREPTTLSLNADVDLRRFQGPPPETPEGVSQPEPGPPRDDGVQGTGHGRDERPSTLGFLETRIVTRNDVMLVDRSPMGRGVETDDHDLGPLLTSLTAVVGLSVPCAPCLLWSSPKNRNRLDRLRVLDLPRLKLKKVPCRDHDGCTWEDMDETPERQNRRATKLGRSGRSDSEGERASTRPRVGVPSALHSHGVIRSSHSPRALVCGRPLLTARKRNEGSFLIALPSPNDGQEMNPAPGLVRLLRLVDFQRFGGKWSFDSACFPSCPKTHPTNTNAVQARLLVAEMINCNDLHQTASSSPLAIQALSNFNPLFKRRTVNFLCVVYSVAATNWNRNSSAGMSLRRKGLPCAALTLDQG